jgi:hypothetical protein
MPEHYLTGVKRTASAVGTGGFLPMSNTNCGLAQGSGLCPIRASSRTRRGKPRDSIPSRIPRQSLVTHGCRQCDDAPISPCSSRRLGSNPSVEFVIAANVGLDRTVTIRLV